MFYRAQLKGLFLQENRKKKLSERGLREGKTGRVSGEGGDYKVSFSTPLVLINIFHGVGMAFVYFKFIKRGSYQRCQ